MDEFFAPPKSLSEPMNVPTKTLMGPGPSNMPKRVQDALNNPILGHLHPECLKIMDDIKDGLQYIFQTKNKATMCVSASGHGGMEASLCNLIEDGDVVLIGQTGIWGERAGEMARRYGGDVRVVIAENGSVLSVEDIRAALLLHRPSILFLTQGESSTGVMQPIEEIGQIMEEFNCLLIVDTVASLGGTPFFMDKWHVDAVYTGSQKVLGAPPGITPLSFGERAMEKVKQRRTKVKVYYWDITLLGDYWNCFGRPRIYHHTISSTLLYGLREALAIVCERGLPSLIEQHMQCSYRLQTGITAMGLKMFVNKAQNRLPTVNTIVVPPNVDWLKASQYAMKTYLLEFSGGLGPTAGKVFRIGLMGVNATPEKVDFILKVLKEALQQQQSERENIERSKI